MEKQVFIYFNLSYKIFKVLILFQYPDDHFFDNYLYTYIVIGNVQCFSVSCETRLFCYENRHTNCYFIRILELGLFVLSWKLKIY